MKVLTSEQLEAVLNEWDINHSYNSFRDGLKEKGLIKEEFEAGKWYKADYDDNIIINFQGKGEHSYGINTEGEWTNFFWGCQLWSEIPLLATDKEVETALIKEGDKYIGKTLTSLYCSNKDKVVVGKFHSYDSEGLWYSSKDVDWGNILLMQNGKWATIIEEPKVKEMTMAEVNKALGYEIKIKE